MCINLFNLCVYRIFSFILFVDGNTLPVAGHRLPYTSFRLSCRATPSNSKAIIAFGRPGRKLGSRNLKKKKQRPSEHNSESHQHAGHSDSSRAHGVPRVLSLVIVLVSTARTRH